MAKKDIKSYNMEELQLMLSDMGEPSYRAKQIFSWLHESRVRSFDDMTNISKSLRAKLEESCKIVSLTKERVLTSKIDGTKKYLFEIEGGSLIESVFMRYKHGNSVCISTQSGCRMGCRFCASTLNGLERNLTASEMLDQIYRIEEDTKERVSNVVLMGSGEPMDNFDNVMRFLELISDEIGANISKRNITVSTCGIVENIKRFADTNPQATLALSLHAPNDKLRKELMPIAYKYTIDEVIDACRYYYEKTKRRITFEYSLVEGKNDLKEYANELSGRLKGLNCHVNLIPVNPISEREYRPSESMRVNRFKSILEKNGINVTIRREMGRDISGACGQLRGEIMNKRGGSNNES